MSDAKWQMAHLEYVTQQKYSFQSVLHTDRSYLLHFRDILKSRPGGQNFRALIQSLQANAAVEPQQGRNRYLSLLYKFITYKSPYQSMLHNLGRWKSVVK